MNEAMSRLRTLLSDVSDLEKTGELLGWDRQTNMPAGGAQMRGEHMATVSRLAHNIFTSDEVGQLLGGLEASGVGGGKTDEDFIVLATRRKYDRARKIPSDLVARHARTSAMAQEKWLEGRAKKDFGPFAPALKEVVAIQAEMAETIGGPGGPYDSLLDLTEPGFTREELATLFGDLKKVLVPLVREIGAHQDRVDASFLQQPWDERRQWQTTQEATRAIGFDFTRGRQDRSVHPFETAFSVDDVRITTRIDPNYLPMALYGSMHEAGHGLYEQGLPRRFMRTPVAEGSSSGMHESQSRMWENLVGRSLPFWTFFFPKLQEIYPEQLKGKTAEEMYRAVNHSHPSLIRVEADEVTYNLHIIVRFELEDDILNGRLKVEDLSSAWNKKMKEQLGIEPANDLEGVLQDIHWTFAFASFPSYTLGNVISAQLFEAARKAIPDLDERHAHGDFSALLGWLRDHVHQEGAKYTTKELIRRATGKELTAAPYLDYIQGKFKGIYGL